MSEDCADVWLVSASGGAPRRLAANPGPDVDPVWSHAGDRIAFVGALRANDYYSTTHVMVAPVEGGAACDLTAALGIERIRREDLAEVKLMALVAVSQWVRVCRSVPV